MHARYGKVTLVTQPPRTGRSYRLLAVLAAVSVVLLSACSAAPVASAHPSVLQWYLPPDRVDAAALARACSAQSDGAYEIRTHTLPADADARHNLLVRRLGAKDRSIDIIGLDDWATAELAAARLLAPIPAELVPEYSRAVFPKALAAASYDGVLVAAPWWLDPQLLWVRGSAAERAGLDLSKPISWEELLAGAARIGVSVDVDDHNGRGVADWVSALIADAGGTVVDGQGRRPNVGLSGAAGSAAAAVSQLYAESSDAPGPSPDATARFAGTHGGFLLAPSSALSDPALAPVARELAWAPYPVIDAATRGIAPLAGVNLAVPMSAPHAELSFAAISCLTSDTVMAALMFSAGHSAARSTAYSAPGVAESFPMAGVVRSSLAGGATVPQTPYWHLVRAALEQTWLPLSAVTAATPRTAQHVVRALLAGELP